MRSICVFGGARHGNDKAYGEAAQRLGAALAATACRLIFGAGSVGLMGRVADGALAGGGEVIGVIPQFLAKKDIIHPRASDTVIVGDLFERKAKMIELSDAYIALPGGLGTLDELLEVMTWRQLGQLDAPIGLLDVNGYFAPWLNAFRSSALAGFLDHGELDRLIVAEDSDSLIASLLNAKGARCTQ